METPSPGSSADLELVRSCSGRPVCISRNCPCASGSTPYPRQCSARTHWHTNMCSPSERTSTDTVQGQGGRGAGPVSVSILAQQDLVHGNHAPCDNPSLADSFLKDLLLRNGAPSGTRVQTSGNSMCGPWTARRGSS